MPYMAEPTVFLQAWGKLLLILHALCGILLLGSMTHNVLLVVPYLWGRYKRIPLEKLYVKVAFVAYLLTFGLGALTYPNYRYHVRALHFDKELPWGSNLFDIKEHWAGVGLAVFVAFLILSRIIDPKKDKDMLGIYAFCSVVLALIVWFNVISGLLLTSYRGV